MSIYSGFSTRMQESMYNKLIERLIELLQYRVRASLYKREINEYSWGRQFSSVYNQLAELEIHKYLDPKFSKSVKEIARYYQTSPKKRLLNYPTVNRNFTKSPKSSSKNIKKIIRLDQSPVKSTYYDSLMNSYLKKGRMSQSPPKARKKLEFNHREFWLIDDKIQVIQ